MAAASLWLNGAAAVARLGPVAKRFKSPSRALATRGRSSLTARTLPSACERYQSKSISSTALAATAEASEAEPPSVQAATR